MHVAGIIAEYNPVHTGHMLHISRTRAQLGEDAAVLCVMSGNFVQRGDAAILDKTARAEMALRCGADLVFELPLPYALSSAERFARGAVAALDAAGVVDTLSFGSEAGELPALAAAADCIDSPQFSPLLKEALRGGASFAAARQRAAAALLGEGAVLLARPNNSLGVEYLRALRAAGSAMKPLTVARTGAGHDAPAADGECPSAMALRAVLLRGETPPARWMSEPAREIWARETARRRAPVTLKAGERALLARLRQMPEEAFAALPDAGVGMHTGLRRAARAAASWEEAVAAAGTKRYAPARVRRMLLCACLGLTRDAFPERPPYLRLLGAGPGGRALLAEMRKAARVPVLTKPSHSRRLDAAGRALFDLEARAADLYDLCRPEILPAGEEWRGGPAML